MNFKSFLKYNIVIQLLCYSFSFADVAIYARSSSQFEECLRLEINTSNLEGDIDCQKAGGTNGGQRLTMSFNTVRPDKINSQKRSVTIFPYKSDGKTIGGITDISDDKTIYAASLHMFLKPWDNDNKNEALISYLRDKVPLLVSTTYPESPPYFDLVLFIDSKIANYYSDVNQLRELLIKRIKFKSLDTTNTGLQWISPDQVSKVANLAATANSSGTVALIVKNRLNNNYFSEFYLSNTSSNLSTAGSSGSVIFDAHSQSPLGLLQCQMNMNLTDDNNVVQNTMGLYKIISFDILNEFNLYRLDDMSHFTKLLSDKIINTESIESNPANCSPRDGKGGG